MVTQKLISIAVPAYNEQENLFELSARLKSVFDALSEKYVFEVVICENGSGDGSYSVLQQIHEQDSRFKIIRLSRNFNMEGGMMAALSCVTGEACVVMSADLQDPPEMIPEFLRQW